MLQFVKKKKIAQTLECIAICIQERLVVAICCLHTKLRPIPTVRAFQSKRTRCSYVEHVRFRKLGLCEGKLGFIPQSLHLHARVTLASLG
jgi:hypothetical protein